MHDLEYLGKELKSSSNGSSLPPICIFLLALLTPAACFSLHLLIPGGLVHSHLLVANSLSLLLCCAHLVLFMLIHNDGMRLKQVRIKMPCAYACDRRCSLIPIVFSLHFTAERCIINLPSMHDSIFPVAGCIFFTWGILLQCTNIPCYSSPVWCTCGQVNKERMITLPLPLTLYCCYFYCSQFWETLSWSFLMSSLSVLPAAMLLGSHPHSWIKVFVLCR